MTDGAIPAISEDLERTYACRHLLEPPAPEIVGGLIERIAKLTADLREANRKYEWRPITEQDLPQVGDEMFSRTDGIALVSETHASFYGHDPRMWKQFGRWTYFRQHISPAQQEAE